MSENVVKLVPPCRAVDKIDEEVVALLEHLLERAKEGDFNGVMVATIEATAAGALVSVGTAYAGESVEQNVHASIGAASALHGRMLQLLEWPE